jgi:16S rRNA processing protein RimM
LSITQRRDLIEIAEVARAHGVRGELRLKLHNSETTLIAQGRTISLRRPSDKTPSNEASTKDEARRILSVRVVPSSVLIRLEGVTDRDAADALRGARILVPRAELPDLDEGEFYAVDLEGARAELVSGEAVGTVKSLATYPTCEVLVIETTAGQILEVPLVDDVVAEVDAKNRVVRLRSIEGL